MTGLLMALFAINGPARLSEAFLEQAGMSERDSSRALNFARGSFATFLAPSRKVG